MKLSIQLEMPQPEAQKKPEQPKASIEERVREAIELCESGYCSNVEWVMLNRLKQALKQKKQTPRVQNLLNMIQPVLNKYGYHDDTPTEKK